MSVLLDIENLQKYFPILRGVIFRKVHDWVRAVNGLNFSIKESETFGLVGESGSGKTTTGKLVLGILNPTAGRILFKGQDLVSMSKTEMKETRRQMGMIFQDPTSSLNPRKTATSIIEEPIKIHKVLNKHERKKRVAQLFYEVGLGSEHFNRYPHEFSGGQLQRIAIARALALNPKLVVADEPTSALDVSVQAQILNLMQDLQEKFKLSYLFISHDLSVVKHISDRVGVMYIGKLQELASTEELFNKPMHPYTQALLNAIPIPDPKKMAERARAKLSLKGEISFPVDPIKECLFYSRCPNAIPKCAKMQPELKDMGNNHYVACHLI